nr:CARDB domain-containing protein [uncultured Bacteroides sp.]
MKKVLLLFLLFYSFLVNAQTTHNAKYFNTTGISYTYSPAGSLSITDENDYGYRDIIIKYFGRDLQKYGRGYAYLVLSKSASLTDMSNCYMFSLGRYWKRTVSDNTEHVVFSKRISISQTYCKKITAIMDGGGFVGKEAELPKNQKYYHYIVLFVNTGTKLENIVITEPTMSRSTIDYLYKGGSGETPGGGSDEKENYDIELKSIKHYGSVYDAYNYVDVELKVKNAGNVDAENINCQFYVADKNQYKNNYKKVACSNNNSLNISKLSAGQESTFNFSVLLPVEGSLDVQFPNNTALYLLGYIQGLTNEKNTDNNSGGTTISIIH